MFCTKCGAQNADGAAFCQSCGSKLDATSQSAPAPAGSPEGPATSTSVSVQGKSPLVAAVLNFFFGAGYLYLGFKRVLGVPTAVFVVLALIVYIGLGFYTIGIVTLVLAILLAVDGWQKGNGEKGFITAE